MKNETYAGVWHYGKKGDGETTPVSIPEIIDRDKWQAVQERLIERRNKAVGRKPKYEYLMARRLRCSCGYRVKSNTLDKGRNGYYTCPGRWGKKYNSQDCDMPPFQQNLVDAAIWQWVQDIFEDDAILQAGIEKYKASRQEQILPIEAKLQLIDQTITEVEREHEQHYRALGRLDDGMTKAMAGVKADISRCEQQLTELTAKRQAALEALNTAKQGEQNIKAAVDFVAAARADLGDIDWQQVTFATRRFLVEHLNIEATLVVEGEERYLDAKCYFDNRKLSITIRDIINIIQR